MDSTSMKESSLDVCFTIAHSIRLYGRLQPTSGLKFLILRFDAVTSSRSKANNLFVEMISCLLYNHISIQSNP